MRQVFFLLASAMFVAFSLSWASPGKPVETIYAVPDLVLLPILPTLNKGSEISVTFALKDSCESIEQVDRELRDQNLIFSARLAHRENDICTRNARQTVSIKVPIDKSLVVNPRGLNIYFREDDESLRFFGAIKSNQDLFSIN